MESILEYIMEYYTWFLGGAIIILLAIIGYYADKTNFGQGKNEKKETNKDDKLVLNENNENQLLEKDVDKININQNSVVENQETMINQMEPTVDSTTDFAITQETKTVETSKLDANQEIDSNIQRESEMNFEDEFEKFDKEFDELLPKKDIINNELLEEIDNLSLDKTQKLELNEIPDLDDVDLPKIKSFEPEEKDVWKF